MNPKRFPVRSILLCLLLVACAGGAVQGIRSQAVPAPVAESDEAIREREATAWEEQAYRDSMEKITDKVLHEEVVLAECADAGKNCKDLKDKFCEIDTLIDSRGDHYTKRFCVVEPQR